MTQTMLKLQATIVVYLCFGFALNKTKLIKKDDSIFLSTLILEFILPVSILNSCLRSLNKDTLYAGALILFVAVFFEAVIYLCTKWGLKKMNADARSIFQYGMLVSNGGLIGTPIIEGLFGSAGVLYANIFLIPTRVMAYSAGEALFNRQEKKGMKDTLKGLAKNKVIVSMVLGIVLGLCNLQMPSFLMDALKNVSSCLAPLSLVLVGSMLADKMSFSRNEIGYVSLLCVMRQIIIPLLVMFVVSVLPFSVEVKYTMVLLMGMPIGSTCAIFANKYQKGTVLASESVFISTISSILTLIVLTKIMGYFI